MLDTIIKDFFDPMSRALQGQSINLTWSISFFKHSINLYIYGIVSITFVALFCWQIFKEKNNIKDSWNLAVENSFRILLFFWIFLTINAYYNFIYWW